MVETLGKLAPSRGLDTCREPGRAPAGRRLPVLTHLACVIPAGVFCLRNVCVVALLYRFLSVDGREESRYCLQECSWGAPACSHGECFSSACRVQSGGAGRG